MVIIQEGTKFALENFGGRGEPQVIQFTSKDENGEFVLGTTNEEIVDMLIERMHYLNKKNYSSINQCIIILLKNIRQLMRKRLSKKVENVIRFQEGSLAH